MIKQGSWSLTIRGVFGLILLAFPMAGAAPVALNKQSLPAVGGTLRGGKAESYMSLLDVRRLVDSKKTRERLVLDWGDRILNPAEHGGYYTLEYSGSSRKLILTMSLTMSSKLDTNMVLSRLNDGLFVRSARLEFDPISQAEVLTVNLRQPVKVAVASLEGAAPARLLIDLSP